jgi:hypothetical protein
VARFGKDQISPGSLEKLFAERLFEQAQLGAD